jgi:hypothetical protein
MEYVLSDSNGRTRDYFDDRNDALAALCEEEHDKPGITAGWMLLTFDDDGQEIGEPEWAEDLLAADPPKVGVSFTLVVEGAGLFVARPRGARSGRAMSTRPWFRRLPSVATGTRFPSEVERAAS